MTMLSIADLSVTFGGLHALKNLQFEVEEGEIVSVIGPNGAGKTTFFNMISGMVTPTAGDIIFEGESLLGLDPSQVTERGIARTFQNVRLFANMTILENVMVAQHCRTHQKVFGALFQTKAFKSEEDAIRKYGEEVLSFFGSRLVGYRLDQPASVLSYANRRRLEIARAMATRPRLLLLDEPTRGLLPHDELALMRMLKDLCESFQFTVIFSAHQPQKDVMEMTDQVLLLSNGATLYSGPRTEAPQIFSAAGSTGVGCWGGGKI